VVEQEDAYQAAPEERGQACGYVSAGQDLPGEERGEESEQHPHQKQPIDEGDRGIDPQVGGRIDAPRRVARV
jgi:hypothetical protein